MNKRLRIAAVTHFYPTEAAPQRGVAVYDHLRALSKWADVDVLCIESTYPSAKLLRPRSFPHQQGSRPCPGTTLPTRFIPYPAFPLVSRPLNGVNCSARLLPYIQQIQPDLILASFLYPDGFAAVRTGKKLGIPVIVEALGSDLRLVKAQWHRRMVTWTVQQASFVTTVNEELREWALRFGAPPDRVRTVRRGCDSAVFHLADRKAARAELGVAGDSKLVLFVGRLVKVKGLHSLFEALRGLEGVELAIAGEGPLEAELRKSSIDNNLQVRFLGNCTPQEVARWLAASNLLCLPSDSEGLPNVILEALSCGRAVVASEVGGIPEVVDSRCGILTRPQDPQNLQLALKEGLRREWDERAIASSFRRSWEDVAGETLDIAAQIIHKQELKRSVPA